MKDGGAAFPLQHTEADANSPYFKLGQPGMTLRDYFAGQALAGIMVTTYFRTDTCMERRAGTAKEAYEYADAMLAARKEQK